jgi:serine phosphatase RsbU (regulator of sigma subunit)
MNRERDFFGVERLRTSLSWVAADASAGDVLKRVREDVRKFADGAEAADDITLLVLQWNGP